MAVKCGACGFESADDARWCDFCKEPFRKKASASAAPAVAAAPPPQPAPRPLSATSRIEPSDDAKPVDPKVLQLVKQLSATGDGLTLPKTPGYMKYLAWAFLASWLLTGCILAGVLLARYKDRQSATDTPAQGGNIQVIQTR